MAAHDPQTLTGPRPGRWREAAHGFRAVVGGAAAAWLASEVLLLVLVTRPGAGPGTLRDLGSAIAGIAWLTGLACAVLAPVAALLARAARRVRGGDALACGLVGAAGGYLAAQLLGGNGMSLAVIGAGAGALCGLAGWAASASASRSSARTLALLVIAGGVWAVALLSVSS